MKKLYLKIKMILLSTLPFICLFIAFLYFITLLSPAYASVPVEQMQNNTVFIACIVNDRDMGFGSGFVINDTDIVTNHHVVSCASRGGLIRVFISHDNILIGKIVWQSNTKDLAVIRVETGINRPKSIITSATSVKATDTVYTAGFPLGFNFLDIRSNLTVKISKGIVTAKVKTQDGVRLLQVDAPINPGNSGGPLFNEEGRVIGINWAKAQNVVIGINPEDSTITAQRVPSGEGIGWAIESDELIVELKSAGISFSQGSTLIALPLLSSLKKDTLLLGVIVVAIFVGGALVFVLIKRKTPANKGIDSHLPMFSANKKPMLVALSGPLKGAIVELNNMPVTIGRDPSMSNLIMPHYEDTISKRHCTVRFDPTNGRFYIIDHSRNGTFLQDGTRLSYKQEMSLLSGSRFYVSSPKNLFEVRF